MEARIARERSGLANGCLLGLFYAFACVPEQCLCQRQRSRFNLEIPHISLARIIERPWMTKWILQSFDVS
jgi:hypothetical protein